MLQAPLSASTVGRTMRAKTFSRWEDDHDRRSRMENSPLGLLPSRAAYRLRELHREAGDRDEMSPASVVISICPPLPPPSGRGQE